MLFNSIEFAIFFPIVFFIYWFVVNKNLRAQNLFLIAASFLFYGWWDWRFLFLLIISTVVDYIAGILIFDSKSARRKKTMLLLSIVTNLGILGFFKYFNFFADSAVSAFHFFGSELSPVTLKILLPVGVSFYTFQALSYTIEVYRGKLIPTRDPVSYFAFISFFPQLVAGPIERASHMLPQYYVLRHFNWEKARDGMRQILWGLFKKMVIADNCASIANDIFSNPETQSGSSLLLGALCFSFQIYGDFSGYSDIALGTARLLGFELMRNFSFPYFSRDIAEFWRRWHISLTSWFRDYVYIPLGGSQGSLQKKIRNTFIIFLLSGFWHGANWTFVIWGLLNAIYFLPLLLRNKNRSNMNLVAEGKLLPSLKEFFQMTLTFSLVVLAWIFFRAENISSAFFIIKKIFSLSLISVPSVLPYREFFLITFLLVVEWLQRNKQHALQSLEIYFPKAVRWGIYFALVISLLLLAGSQKTFIYFQF